MFFNQLYRSIRFRADDPLRYLHVPRRARVDVDEPAEIDPDIDRTLDLSEIATQRVIPAEELA